jgi:hypothetical protein
MYCGDGFLKYSLGLFVSKNIYMLDSDWKITIRKCKNSGTAKEKL